MRGDDRAACRTNTSGTKMPRMAVPSGPGPLFTTRESDGAPL
ncbi:hypothetical protein [Streptomyces sp. NPDC058603]